MKQDTICSALVNDLTQVKRQFDQDRAILERENKALNEELKKLRAKSEQVTMEEKSWLSVPLLKILSSSMTLSQIVKQDSLCQ